MGEKGDLVERAYQVLARQRCLRAVALVVLDSDEGRRQRDLATKILRAERRRQEPRWTAAEIAAMCKADSEAEMWKEELAAIVRRRANAELIEHAAMERADYESSLSEQAEQLRREEEEQRLREEEEEEEREEERIREGICMTEEDEWSSQRRGQERAALKRILEEEQREKAEALRVKKEQKERRKKWEAAQREEEEQEELKRLEIANSKRNLVMQRRKEQE